MEDETGTVTESETTDVQETQTETTDQEQAATETTETQTDQPEAEETTDDDDLSWATKKGVPLDDKKAIAKMLRNADRKVSEASLQKKTTLQDAVDQTSTSGEDDDVITELQSKYRVLETKFAATQYYLDNPDDKAYDAEATAILKETLETDPDFARALGRNLPKLFDLARSRHAGEQVAKAKEEGRKEERRNLASKQRAAAPSQAATTHTPPEDKEMAAFMKGFNNPW
jgi:hypothetical protein